MFICVYKLDEEDDATFSVMTAREERMQCAAAWSRALKRLDWT